MHFKPKGTYNKLQSNIISTNINDYEIKEVDATKFLGIIIDKNLSWLPATPNCFGQKTSLLFWPAKSH